MSLLLPDCFLEAMAGFDPELLSGVDCAVLAKKVATAVKAGEAVCLLASARAVAGVLTKRWASTMGSMDGPPGGRHHRRPPSPRDGR